MNRTRMLTADEIEALRRHAKAVGEFADRAFGRAPSEAEMEARRRGDEWWENRLREMRRLDRC